MKKIEIVREQPIYKDLGQQLLDVRAMTLDNSDAPRARDRYQKVINAVPGLSTSGNSEGGYLVETDHSRDIYTTAIETGIFSSRCTQQPISDEADGYNYHSADDRDRSDGLINGIAVYRKAEADTISSTGKASLDDREIRVIDMYGLVYLTNRMLRDATAMAAYVERTVTKQFAFKLDQEIYQGTGAG